MTLPRDLASRAMALGLAAHVVEVGGSSVQSALLGENASVTFTDGPLTETAPGLFGLTAPGLVINGRVWGATQVGWDDVDAWRELGYRRPPDVSMNDAEAAALGEWLLRGERRPSSLLYAGLGTGLGGAMISDGEIVPVDLSHQRGYGDAVCDGCGAGCLNAQIGGQYLPRFLGEGDKRRVVGLLATGIRRAGVPAGTVVVLAGGLVRRSHPELLPALRGRLRGVFPVEGSAAPDAAKSAAYVGVFDRLAATAGQ
ncbi:ROK family protein [Streptomyces litchfieldiae]|uniref:ROK family protein n=1 Tax=Streptomyces litchfieldiae TaxID=3075543 RepID=A0ABU2MUH9_9ACTN|nr:ROK family protein [Streptomyces sp. DSM 44938]MDT0345121.1 ROK family protein [Streptomyces sp. DSM 44938]